MGEEEGEIRVGERKEEVLGKGMVEGEVTLVGKRNADCCGGEREPERERKTRRKERVKERKKEMPGDR